MKNKFTLDVYFDKDKNIQAVSLIYNGVRHCTADIRTNKHSSDSVFVISKITADNKILNLLEECVTVCGYTKITKCLILEIVEDIRYVYLTTTVDLSK